MAKGQKNNDGVDGGGNSYFKFTGMGFQMLAIIGICTFVGYKIDEAGHHAVKWVTAVLSLTGVFISLYLVIRSVKE